MKLILNEEKNIVNIKLKLLYERNILIIIFMIEKILEYKIYEFCMKDIKIINFFK